MLFGINDILMGYTANNNPDVLIFNIRAGGSQGIQTWEHLMLRLDNIVWANLRTAVLSSGKKKVNKAVRNSNSIQLLRNARFGADLLNIFFCKQCGHTEGFLRWRLFARVKRPCAFRLRMRAQNAGPGIGVRHFSSKFRHKMALVKCPCAFRLRRLAQNMCRGIGVL